MRAEGQHFLHQEVPIPSTQWVSQNGQFIFVELIKIYVGLTRIFVGLINIFVGLIKMCVGLIKIFVGQIKICSVQRHLVARYCNPIFGRYFLHSPPYEASPAQSIDAGFSHASFWGGQSRPHPKKGGDVTTCYRLACFLGNCPRIDLSTCVQRQPRTV